MFYVVSQERISDCESFSLMNDGERFSHIIMFYNVERTIRILLEPVVLMSYSIL